MAAMVARALPSDDAPHIAEGAQAYATGRSVRAHPGRATSPHRFVASSWGLESDRQPQKNAECQRLHPAMAPRAKSRRSRTQAAALLDYTLALTLPRRDAKRGILTARATPKLGPRRVDASRAPTYHGAALNTGEVS